MRLKESINSRTVRIGPCGCKLYHFEPAYVSLILTLLLLIHSELTKGVVKANVVCLMSSWTKLHLNGLEILLLVPLRKDKSLIFYMWPSRPFLFQSQIPHCGLPYFHLLCNLLDLFHGLSFDVILNYSSYVQSLIT